MPELPTCLCVRGLPPYDRLTAIYQAAAELSGDGDLPDPVCVAGVPPFSRFSYIYEAFRVFTGDDSLPSQICVSGESPQDQVSRIYQAVAIYADDSSLLSYECVRGMPMWQQWIEIYRALYLAAGAPDTLLNPACVTIANLDVLSDVFCALTQQGTATLLASFYIPEIVDSFERDIAAGFTAETDPDPYQREAEPDVLRDDHWQDGIEGQLVILEDEPTPCDLIAPEIGTPVVSVNEVSIPFTPGYGDVGSTEYSWDLTDIWNDAGASPLVVTGTAGSHVIYFRDVSPSGVPGQEAPSDSFDLEAEDGDPSSRVDLVFRYIGDSAPGGEGDPISTWPDSSGNGNDATALSGVEPVKNLAVANLHAGVRFGSGSLSGNDYFNIPDCLSALTEGTLYVVLRAELDPSADSQLAGSWDLGSQDFAGTYPWVDGTVFEGFGTSVRKTVGDLSLDLSSEFRVYTVVSSPTEFTAYLDSVEEFTTATNTVSFPSSLSLGRSFGGALYLNAVIVDIFVASSADDSATVSSTAGWLKNHYAP